MWTLETAPAYSYRDDPSVPAFPDDNPLILFDGTCVLCSSFAHFVAKHDTSEAFRFAPAQSDLGRALFRHYALNDTDFETNLLIDEGRAFGRVEAFTEILRKLRFPWSIASGLLLLPRPLRDWLYERLARNRYGVLGRYDRCVARDDPLMQRRLIA
jgi:predicted DCC family thiol-disulfide oxidoreductase YuxK